MAGDEAVAAHGDRGPLCLPAAFTPRYDLQDTLPEKKSRAPIPEETAARVLWASDRTCCVCQQRGLPIQIHHIDGDPSNNDEQNLAVLCLTCHRDTQISGGFDRKLNAAQVRLYRDDWTERVALRRDFAVQPPSVSSSAEALPSTTRGEVGATTSEFSSEDDGIMVSLEESGLQELASLIRDLPRRRREAYRTAQPKWDAGTTADMHEGNRLVTDALQEMLIDLARFYPDGHFGDAGSEAYFDQRASELGRWHWMRLVRWDPPGTMWGVAVGGEVTGELERMVVQMVAALTWGRSGFNFKAWSDEWERAA